MRTFLLALLLTVFVGSLQAQETSQTATMPNVKVKDLGMNVIETGTWAKDSLLVVSFWATWCKPCILELQTYAEHYEEWQKTTDVRIVAVSIDDSRNARKVPGFVKGRAWPFDVVLDENADFKRAMNVNNVPHTFVLKNGKVVWQHSAFAPGDEEDLQEQLIKLSTADGTK